ncbi:MAG: glycosyltransferase family 4 protein [Desulfobacteraceae bacterium]|jgi:glycosyltransferase involved in cell wall biosynthesis|nr:glycosyltransferase family 4 protein [Desulfobacteraceae bacterium]
MNFCYLLESADLGGGVRVVFDQVRALIKRGHRVAIRSLKGDSGWYSYPLEIDFVDRLDIPFPAGDEPDVVICTYWTTIDPGIRLAAPVILHLCQGYEGDIPELKTAHPDIVSAYRQRVPKITVGEWLSERLCEIFGNDQFPVFKVGQIVDTSLFTPRRIYIKNGYPNFLRRFMPINIMVVGDYMISCKGIADALKAVAILRKEFSHIRVIRASLFPVTVEEQRITPVDESYVKLPPRQMVSLFMKTDLLLAPSLPEEGFGLPAAEAMACGIPVVLTKIPSYLSFDSTHDYACFVDIHSPAAIAACASGILNNRSEYIRISRRGVQVIQNRFNSDKVAENIEKIAESFLSPAKELKVSIH